MKTELRPDDELVIVLVDDAGIQEINETFLGHEGPTDVITFDYRASDDILLDGPRTIGEIYVSTEVAERAAVEHGHSVSAELVLYIVHGILHLDGLDDHNDDDRKEMREHEARVMATLRQTFDVDTIFDDMMASSHGR